MNKIKFVFGCLSLSILLFISCKIGLGQAVDTKAPELSVLSPEPDSIIRDKFSVAGEWSDDGEIESLVISLEKPDGTSSPIEYKGSIDKENGTWQCIIDPLDASKPISDGTYEATITITDTYKHQTVATRMFAIDNTPPIVVLQRPSSKASVSAAEFDSYGQSFTLEGQAADDNNVDLIVINIYSDAECTNLVHTIKKENVPPTISLDIATFEEGVENDYSKIYGTTSKQGAKNFYCTISAYDGAKRYPVSADSVGEDDARGNVVNSYYLYDEVSSQVLSKYKITEVYHMLNGAYVDNEDSSRTAEEISGVKKILSAAEIKTGAFSLNPANNPMFSVSGKDNLKKDGTDFTANQDMYVSNGNSVVVEVSPGLDGISLDANSLKVYVIECDSFGNPLSAAEKKYPVTSQSKSGSSYKFVTEVSTASGDLQIGKDYLFGVEGKDTSGNAVIPKGSGYGFHFASSGAAPTLEITEPVPDASTRNFYLTKTQFDSNSKKQVIKGNVTVEEGTPTVYLKNGSTIIYTKTFDISDAIDKGDEKKHYSFSFDIGEYNATEDLPNLKHPSFLKQDVSQQYTYTVEAKQDGVPSTKDCLITYDIAAPTFDIEDPSPIATYYFDKDNKLIETGTWTDTTKYINGSVQIKYEVNDDDKVDDSSIKYYIFEGKHTDYNSLPEKNTAKISGILSKKGTQNVNTTLLSDGSVTLVFEAKDKAGNFGSKIINTYEVKQSTDKPVIIPNNVKNMCELKFDEYKGEVNNDTGKTHLIDDLDDVPDLTVVPPNLFYTDKSMYFTAYDDDGVKKVIFDNYKEDGVTKDNDTSGQNTLTGSEKESAEFSLPPAGIYKLVVTVIDNNNVSSEPVIFWYKVIGSAPTFSKIEGVAGKYVSTNTGAGFVNSMDISFEIDETTPPYTITAVQTPGGDPANPVTIIANTNERTISKTYTPEAADSGSASIQFFLKDKYRNTEKTYKYNFTIDNDVPEVTIGKLPSTSETENSSYKFTGTAQDNTSGSGVDKVQFAFKENPADSEIYEASGTDPWTANVVFEDYFTTEGVKNIWVRAKDKVGNTSAWTKSGDFIYDKADPSISITKVKGNTISGTNFQFGEGFSFEGTVSDGYDLDETDAIVIEQTFNDTEKTTIKIPKSSIASTNWILENLPRSHSNPNNLAVDANSKVISGTYKFKFTAKDKVGKTKESTTYTVVIDNQGPTLTLKNPSEAIDISGDNSLSGSEFTFKASATDNTGGTGVNKLYYLFSTEDKDKTAYTGFENLDASDGLTVNITEDLVAGHSALNNELYEAQWYFILYATDEAGNKSNIIKKPIYVDMSAPIVTETSSTSKVKKTVTDNGKVTLGGTITESNKLSSFEIYRGTNTTPIKTFTLGTGTGNISYSPDGQSWTYSETPGDGTYTYKIIATDVAGKKNTVLERTIIVDTVEPTVDVTKVKLPNALQTESSLFKFEGEADCVKDPVTGSGVSSGFDKLEIAFTTSATAPSAADFTVTPAADGSWSSTVEFANVSAFSTQGTKYIWLKVYDNAGNTSGWVNTYKDSGTDKPKTFEYDTEAPVISFAATDVTTDPAVNPGENSFMNKSVQIKVDASDSYGVDNVTVSTTPEITGFNGTLAKSTGNTYLKTFTAGAGKNIPDGTYTFTVTVTDKAGKTNSVVRKFTVDTVAPSSVSAVVSDPSAPKPEGSLFYNKSQVTFKVTATETGSEIKSVSYKESTASDWSTMALRTDYYDASVSGLSDGEHKYKFKVEDNAGNVTETSNDLVFNIDTTAPESVDISKASCAGTDYSASDLANAIMVNGREALTLTFTVKDVNATDPAKSTGVDSITLEKVGSTKASTTVTATATANTDEYTITIPASELKSSGNIVLNVKDKAGNASSITTNAQINKDNTPPTINSIVPSNYVKKEGTGSPYTYTVNGAINLSGKAADSNLATVDVCYWDSTASKWVNIFHSTAADPTDWETDALQTTSLTDNSTYTFAVIAIDKAGNCNLDTVSGTTVTVHHAEGTGTDAGKYYPTYTSVDSLVTAAASSAIKLAIDQDTDRPEITLSDMDLTASMATTNAQYGMKYINLTVTDDDGVTKVEYSLDGTNYTDITSSGLMKISNIEDGNRTIYFKVTDSVGNVFTSSTTNSYAFATPKITDGTNKYGYKDSTSKISALKLKVDTMAPSVEAIQYSYDGTEWKDNINTAILGGKNNKIYVRQFAYDANSIICSTAANVESAKTYLEIEKKTGDESGATYKYVLTENTSETKTIGTTTYCEYKTAQIDVSKFATGARNLTIYVSDGGSTTSTTKQIDIDNTAPEITCSAPSSTQYSSGNITAYGTNDTADATISYALSKDTIAPAASVYETVNGTSFQWFVYFDGGATTSTSTHDVTFNQYLIDFGITTSEAIANKSFTDIVPLYLWIKAVDVAGNETVEKFPVLVDPQGDAPKITLDYPEKDGTILGGAVTLRGTATDTIGTNIGVDSIWVQIISAKENGYESSNTSQLNKVAGGITFDDVVETVGTSITHTYTLKSFAPKLKDVKQWVAKGYDVYTNITSASPTKVTSVSGSDTSSGEAYFIKANISGSAWNCTINNSDEFNPAEGKLNLVAYRAYALDKDYKLSRYEQQFGVFDSDTPVISNVYLRQYSNNDAGTGDITASKAYEADMWVKGTWWLCGNVTDTQGLKTLTVKGVNQNPSGTAKAVETFKYKLDSGTGVGKLSITVEATDKASTPHTGTLSCSINYDNQEPALLVSTDSNFNIKTPVQNSNGFYSFGSQVMENPIGTNAQSGFDYLAFWFEREITGTVAKHVVYDVMRSKESAKSEVAWSGLSSSEGLMWKTKTVTRSASSLGTLTLPAADSNIHAGGLCKIGGTIYFIDSVSGTTVTIKGQPEMPASGTSQTAYFAIANVVNNTIETGSGTKSKTDGKYGYYEVMSNDDGDNMVESVSKTGTTWTWDASINSLNIPDGPITIHYVAFDKAGNFMEGAVTNAKVSNNAPRIVGVTVKSDYNGNGTFEDNEKTTMYYSTIQNGTREVPNNVTSFMIASSNKTSEGKGIFTLKDNSEIEPEIIGGNGKLKYDYNVSDVSNGKAVYVAPDSITSWTQESFYKVNATTKAYEQDTNFAGNNYDESDPNFENTLKPIIPMPVDSFMSHANSTIDEPTWFTCRIWDSTEGTTMYNNSQYATLQVAVANQVNDNGVPKVVVNPFHWNSKADNSVYWDDDGKAQGHIELEGDLSQAVIQLYGNDPKVSGTIVIDGWAYDNIRLKQLFVSFAGHSAIRNSTKAAEYANGTWTSQAPLTSLATNGWAFEVDSTSTNTKDETKNTFIDGKGHKVLWKLYVDTAKISGVAATDVVFNVSAKDMRGIVSNAATGLSSATGVVGSSTDSYDVYNKPSYQMDVVPYITSIQTTERAQSGLKDNNIRSASGKYSIIATSQADFITVNGFNLETKAEDNTTTLRIVQNPSEGVTTYTGLKISTAATAGKGYKTFKVQNNGTKSGYVEFVSKTNNIRALNNLNNNDSAGTFTKKNTVNDYADMPNRACEADFTETKNVQLTDDRYIRFFDMKKTGTKNGYYPVMIMDGDDPVFGYVDSNGCTDGTCTYQPESFQPQRRKFNGSNGNVISTEYLVGGTTFDQMAMAKDSAGRYYQVSVYNRNGGSMALYYDKYASLYNNTQAGNAEGKDKTYYNNVAWQLGTSYVGYQGNYTYNGNNNALSLDGLNIGSALVDRFQNIKLIADGYSTTTDGARVYHAYYDDRDGKIYFRQFRIGKRVNGSVTNQMYSGNGYEQYTNLTEGTTSTSTVNRKEVTSGSKHYDMGIVKSGNNVYAVIVYYDFSAGQLKIRYSTALNGTPGQAITWTTSSINLPNYVGQYVSMAVSGTSLHIAAFDANNSDLKYIYVPTYNGKEYSEMTVDAAGSVGNWTQIKLHNNVPYIAYYNATETGGRDAIKLAYANATVGSVTAGVDKDTSYTSTGWEYMTVPSVDPANGGSMKFQSVCLDFDSAGRPVVGYLGTNLEFGKWLDE